MKLFSLLAALIVSAFFGTLARAQVVATPNVKPTLRVVTAAPDKIFYKVTEPITGVVEIQNDSTTVLTLHVEAWLEAGLDASTPAQSQQVVIQPGKTGQASFRWKAAPLGMYGYALRARVVGVGARLEAREYFTVCDNYWNVALSSSHPLAYTALSSEKQATERLAQLRKEYYNGYEKFFWAPDDFAEMTPQQDKYFSGQARYYESTAINKFLVVEGHRYGMQATTYGKSVGGGSAGAAFTRAHPEMVYRTDGRLNIQAKVRALYYWDKAQNWSGQDGAKWQDTNWVFYNMNKPEVVEYGSQEIARSAQMFGWDGVRFDGHFAAQASWQDEDGKTHALTPQERDAQTAANIRRMKEIIHVTRPDFYFGYNYLNGGAAEALRAQPLEFKELCRGGGHIMNEYIGQVSDVNHPLHRWENFTTLMADDAQVVQQNGGHYFPILNYVGPDLWHVNAVAYAAGAHPYYKHVWGAFATRYAGVLWDRALKRMDDPSKLLSTSSDVWWNKFVHQKSVGKNRQQVIVHFINPPVKEVVTNDKDGKFPEVLKNVALQVSPAGLGKNWKLTSATLLDPDDVSQQALPFSNGKSTSITVPEVRLWKVLVLDFSKN